MQKPYCFALVITLLSVSCHPLPPSSSEPLIGVWSGLLFQTESPYDSITLSPVRFPSKAHLYKNGQKKVFPLNEESAIWQFKGKGGLRFHAGFSQDSSILHAILTQNLWAQGFVFTKKSNYWHALIPKPEIIDTDYLVYLELYRDESGAIQAKMQSNKENRELHFTIDSVTIRGDSLEFNISNDRFHISAIHNLSQKTLSLSYANPGGERRIELVKLAPHEYEGYRPRPLDTKYTYSVPKLPEESIPSASLEEVGIDVERFLAFMDEMNQGDYDHIHSILVSKDQKLVFEEYFHGYHREYLHDIRSAFKSLASLALGKAMMEDSSLQVNTKILDYYPGYEITALQKQAITIHHALTMSTGITLEDEDEMQGNHPDWVGYKLKLPMKYPPGEHYEYSSGGSHLLSGIIQKSSEQYLPLFLAEKIMGPMDIKQFQMLTSPYGRAYLAGSFYMRPLDLSKFGLLIINGGKWKEKTLIPASWIEQSTHPHIQGSWPENSDYGYLWRILERNVGGKAMKTIEAWGNGGQFLIIIPEVEMTITITGGNYNLFPEMEEKPFKILEEYILPSVNIE